MGRAKRRAFNEIKDRVWSRLQGWKEKLLSQAGREVLIKAVIQAIPTYAMSCFKFPAGFCADLSAMATRFWWGQRGVERKIHWLSKSKLMKAKNEGGMGFRDLQLFNKALLARQGWRLLHQPASLLCRVLKAKYFPNHSFLDAAVPINASYIWRSICEAKEILINGTRWRVGRGDKIKIWKDRWLPSPSTFRVISPVSGLDPEATVDTLICVDSMSWNLPLLHSMFLKRDVESILAIPLSKRKPSDVLIWNGTKQGTFSVKSAYRMLYSHRNAAEASSSAATNSATQFWSSIWATSVPPKVRVFVWRACQGILPTQTHLFDKGISNTFSCVWCGDEAETEDHLLWKCEFAQRVWQECPVNFASRVHGDMSFTDFMDCCVVELGSLSLEITFCTAWAIWKARNELVWNNHITPVAELCQQAAGLALDFLESGSMSREAVTPPNGLAELKWKPPGVLHHKLNFSCRTGSGDQQVGLGVLLRDSAGLVAASMWRQFRGEVGGVQVQAQALLMALEFAFSIGLRSLEVDIGNNELYGLLQKSGPCLAHMGVLIDDIHSWTHEFHFMSFSFIKNVCNKAAQALATEALSSSFEQVWLDDHPACITSFVQFDSLQ